MFQNQNRLWLPLQSSPIYVKRGGTLRLLCILVSNTSEVRIFYNIMISCYIIYAKLHYFQIFWKFNSHLSKTSPKILLNQSVELKINNVNDETHDGIYSCHWRNKTQVYDVYITTHPIFTDSLMSINSSSNVASVPLNCSALGNPMPVITWYC